MDKPVEEAKNSVLCKFKLYIEGGGRSPRAVGFLLAALNKEAIDFLSTRTFICSFSSV